LFCDVFTEQFGFGGWQIVLESAATCRRFVLSSPIATALLCGAPERDAAYLENVAFARKTLHAKI